MQVIQVYMNNSLRNYNYIIYSEKTKEAIFIDPYNLDQTLPIALSYNLKPKYLFNTHHHHDHIQDNQKFLDGDESRVLIELKDQEVFCLSENEKIKAIATPGHVAEHICYLLIENDKQTSFISGDAVFNAGIGNTKNGGNLDKHFESTIMINKLLEDEVKLYPSHDYLLTNLRFAKTIEKDNQTVLDLIAKRETQDLNKEFINTTIKIEREINPFFRLQKLRELQKYKDYTDKEVFLELRALRDRF